MSKLKILFISTAIGLISYLMYNRCKVFENNNKPKYYVYCQKNDTSHLKHVYKVLDDLGFERTLNATDWDLLWAHDYPFNKLSKIIDNLKIEQKVNHFPGCGYLTNKIDLSISSSRYLPKAFKIPEDEDLFQEYVSKNPDKMFVEKSNDHRGIRMKSSKEFHFSSDSKYFIQEFIQRPFLIDGLKFDIGVYTVITSIDPLRVYTFKADVLFRFCPVEYYPLDSQVLDKYIVGDDYLPIWEVPSLKYYYTKLGFSMKDSFDAHLESLGKDSGGVWNDINKAINDVILMKENSMKSSMARFGNGGNFFELMRFDFIIDEDLNVFMMEANMSPNLSSAHFPPNRVLYEQVIFNTFALIGIGRSSLEPVRKNLVVLPDMCKNCDDCFRTECSLCSPCFTPEIEQMFVQSYREHHNKMEYQRIFPPAITKNMSLKDYTLKNQLSIRWYQGKCELDKSWCY